MKTPLRIYRVAGRPSGFTGWQDGRVWFSGRDGQLVETYDMLLKIFFKVVGGLVGCI